MRWVGSYRRRMRPAKRIFFGDIPPPSLLVSTMLRLSSLSLPPIPTLSLNWGWKHRKIPVSHSPVSTFYSRYDKGGVTKECLMINISNYMVSLKMAVWKWFDLAVVQVLTTRWQLIVNMWPWQRIVNALTNRSQRAAKPLEIWVTINVG